MSVVSQHTVQYDKTSPNIMWYCIQHSNKKDTAYITFLIQTTKACYDEIWLYIQQLYNWNLYMGQVMKVCLSCYLVLLWFDSKTR